MGLNLENGLTQILFSVDGLGSGEDESQWVMTTVSVNNRVFHYEYVSEAFERRELEAFRNRLTEFLDGRITEGVHIGFTEPDYSFIFHPKINLKEQAGIKYVQEGHEWIDISMEFLIDLTDGDGSYCGERYSISFGRDTIEKWRDYLNEVLPTLR